MSTLFKASLLISAFFALNKIVALYRQWLVASTFAFSAEIDAFNVSNNIPDLLFSLISGSALSFVFIPILSQYFDQKGTREAWKLFSSIATIVLAATTVLAILFALYAPAIVSSEFGIAPGFDSAKQALVVYLMRVNLVGTIIFSLSGLATAALQAQKHFLLPALSPILYNVGQIAGIVWFTNTLNMGVYGLAYGVVLGALLHFAIQIPGLIRYKFSWERLYPLSDPHVTSVLALMLPRIATVFFIQVIFLARDNLASRLSEGAVTALTYGYFIQQVPETLVGTAIGTAVLPTLSRYALEKDRKKFDTVLSTLVQTLIPISLLIAVVSSVAIEPFIALLFDFSPHNTASLIWTSRAFMIGLTSQIVLEVLRRSFYARKDVMTPLVITAVRALLYIVLGLLFMNVLDAPGLALADSTVLTIELAAVAYILRKHITKKKAIVASIAKTVILATAYLASIGLLNMVWSQPNDTPYAFVVIGLGGILFYGIRGHLHTLMRIK